MVEARYFLQTKHLMLLTCLSIAKSSDDLIWISKSTILLTMRGVIIGSNSICYSSLQTWEETFLLLSSHFPFSFSPPTTGITRRLKGHPYFLLAITVHIKTFFLSLYFPLISQPIKINKVLPLTPVFVSNLIITITKPISYTTDWAQCKTSSWVSNTYNRDNTCLVFKWNSFTLTKKLY